MHKEIFLSDFSITSDWERRDGSRYIKVKMELTPTLTFTVATLITPFKHESEAFIFALNGAIKLATVEGYPPWLHEFAISTEMLIF